MTNPDHGLFDPIDDVETPLDETVSYKEQLVGEGKKYRDEEALAKAALEKDRFIERIQRENATLRSEVQKRETMEELVKRLTPARPSEDTDKKEPLSNPGSVSKDGLTPEEVRQLLSQELAARTDAERRQNNARAVREELLKRYGQNWQTPLKERQLALDVSEEYLTELAQTNPKVFFSLLGDAPKREPGFTPPTPAFDTAKRPVTGNVKNKAYYDRILKEQGLAAYMHPRVQNEMQEQAAKLGDQFFS